MVYVDNPPAPKRHQDMTSMVENRSDELWLEKSGPYQVARAMSYTVTIDISGLHNTVAIDKITLSQAVREINQDASRRSCKNQFSTEHIGTPKKLQATEIFREEMVRTAPENYGRSLTAPRVTVCAERCGRCAPTGKGRRRPTEYVVNRVIGNMTDGRCMLHRV